MVWLLTSIVGRGVLTSLIAAAAWFGWLQYHDQKIASRVVAKIEEKNNANVSKAHVAGNLAEQLPADRLCGKYCRD